MATRGLEYIVEYKGLTTGTYEIDYHVDSEFFEMFPESEFHDADVDVHVTMDVSLAGLVIGFDIKGTVRVECDRCLELFDMPVDAQYSMVVKFGEESSDPFEADDVITISVDETAIDLKQHIYEYIVLSIPARRVHPDGDDGEPTCNPDMVQALENVEVEDDESEYGFDDEDDESDSFDEGDDDDPDDGPDDTDPDGIDPRWEKLRNLL